VESTRINKVFVRQLIAQTLVAWMKWQIGSGSKRVFYGAVEAMAATLHRGEGPQFRSEVWMQALRIVDRWNRQRKVPHSLMRQLLKSYEAAFW